MELVLRQPLRSARVFWGLVVMAAITIGLLAYDRPPGSTVATVLAVVVVVLIGGAWAVRRTWVRLVENRIEIREWPHSTRIVTRSAVAVIDLHTGGRVALYSGLDKLGELPTGWGRTEAERLAQELGARVCLRPGPDCPIKRK